MHVDSPTIGLHVVQKPGQFDLCRGHKRSYHFSLEIH